jgi:hypothetical protein
LIPGDSNLFYLSTKRRKILDIYIKNMAELKDGTVVNDDRLNRLVQYDERSKDFPIRQLLGSLQPQTRSWAGYITNQMAQGSCVGHAVTQEAASRPTPLFGDPVDAPVQVSFLNDLARKVYYRAQQLDQWPGGEYDGADPVYSGTSLLAGMKAGMEEGWWKEFRWALGPGAEVAAQDVILTISHVGPVVMGSFWYSGMWKADAEGYLRATGWIEGGHAYLLTRYDALKDAVYTPNSWGGHGAGWITRADLVKLLGYYGEAAVAIAHDPKPEPTPEPTPEPIVPEPVAPEPKPVYKTFPPSNIYHKLSHMPKKKGVEVTDLTGLVPCKTCKPDRL